MFDPGKPCELAHNTSGIVVGVAICFINPTAIEGTFGQVIANVVKIVQRLDAFADALNPLSRISNFVLKSTGTAMQATLKNGKMIIKVAMRADEVFREVDWSLAKTAQMIGPDGRTYTVLMSNDPMDAARTAGRKLKEILEDEKGNSITDTNGNGLAKVEVTDGEGNITEEVAIVKLGTEISEEAADLLTRLKNKLKSNYKWTDEEILAFEGDFKGDLELLRKFDGDQGLVDSWKLLGEYPIIRKNITNLENLSNVVSKYSLSKSQVDELAEIIAKNGSKQKLLQQLDYATKYIDNPDDLFKLARIAPIKATRNLPGTNGKIAIIGRKMDLVKVYKDELVAAGKQVEIFDGNVIPASARREMQDALASGKWLDETSEIYKANKEWVEKLINEGYEIIDVGNPLKQGESIFYNLETKIIFGN